MDTNKEKIRIYKQNIQESWNMTERPNLQIVNNEEGTKLQIEGTENLFGEVAENESWER